MTATNMCSNFGGKWDSPHGSMDRGEWERNNRMGMLFVEEREWEGE